MSTCPLALAGVDGAASLFSQCPVDCFERQSRAEAVKGLASKGEALGEPVGVDGEAEEDFGESHKWAGWGAVNWRLEGVKKIFLFVLALRNRLSIVMST